MELARYLFVCKERTIPISLCGRFLVAFKKTPQITCNKRYNILK